MQSFLAGTVSAAFVGQKCDVRFSKIGHGFCEGRLGLKDIGLLKTESLFDDLGIELDELLALFDLRATGDDPGDRAGTPYLALDLRVFGTLQGPLFRHADDKVTTCDGMSHGGAADRHRSGIDIEDRT